VLQYTLIEFYFPKRSFLVLGSLELSHRCTVTVVVTGDKIIAGVCDTGDQFIAGTVNNVNEFYVMVYLAGAGISGNSDALITSVTCASDHLIAGLNDAGDKLITGKAVSETTNR
jgi:hypothetical protein